MDIEDFWDVWENIPNIDVETYDEGKCETRCADGRWCTSRCHIPTQLIHHTTMRINVPLILIPREFIQYMIQCPYKH
ncbi:hypothetical protein BBBOND_0107480 [Babesia bigemina]|uniref:Uncharacterized protein n=1 Tax=Babesia bigemina TaxID=5866 RepID=A0A061D9P5_BABBI|nr:hypothetical protein BBBOND_0107480 [Babesia bigemina]CDR94450.1 hypothetical protein BBBOND_0107480 [Babesia bigemina]|eukprot:XP_012766636.1 hypothetical protein BBBOND_0107480 [Babesia bigemina]